MTVKIDRGRTEITGMELRKRSQSAGPGREKLLLSMYKKDTRKPKKKIRTGSREILASFHVPISCFLL